PPDRGFTGSCGSLYFAPPEDWWSTAPMQNIFRRALPLLAVLALPLAARADEAKLILPDLGSVRFLGTSGRTLLELGLIICALGLIFGSVSFTQLKKLPVHRSMLEVRPSAQMMRPS